MSPPGEQVSPTRRFAESRLLLLTVLLGVGGFKCGECDSCDLSPYHYLPQTSEDNVLNNFQHAYRLREVDSYEALLADDFRFYFDAATREQVGMESWTRKQDLKATTHLMEFPPVTKIVIDLKWPRRSAMNAGFTAPRADWTRLFVTDVYFDVDYAPVGQEVTTFRVENQTQRFFFRRGRTNPPSSPGDTLVYLVEWRDQGTSGGSFQSSEPTSWSSLKFRFVQAPTTIPPAIIDH